MLQVKGPILYFLLLMLGISLDFGLDTSYKRGRFSKTLLEKSFEFVPSRRDDIVTFNLSFMLPLAEVNPVSGKRSRKRDAFMACSSGRVKMIFTLMTKIIALYIRPPIVKVGVPGLKSYILRGIVCLAMFLALDKQF